MTESSQSQSIAPWYHVPSIDLVSAEHPCFVRNVSKAIRMLGEPRDLVRSLEPDSDVPMGLRFQPDDPTCRTVVSLNRKTNNLLLRITVPRRTGRKRKRADDDRESEPWTEQTSRKDVKYLLRSMRDRPQQYHAEVVGAIKSTHVWRSIPDFAYTTRSSTSIHELKSKILPQQYPLLKQWSLPRSYGLADTEIVPPPALSTQSLPFNYTYRQNPALKAIVDPQTGQQTPRNTGVRRSYAFQCQYNDKEWPKEPPPECSDPSSLVGTQKRLYEVMRGLFEERPIWTRRAMLNHLPEDLPIAMASELVAYVAFVIRSGPWRDTLCKYGTDPRMDRSYRKYQSVLIQLYDRDRAGTRDVYGRSWTRSKDKMSHIFTGTQQIPVDGKVWQLCDMQDPQLKALVDVPELYIRAQCETRYFGWYHNGTIAKIRVTLKAKVDALIGGDMPNAASIERFLKLPEQWDPASGEPADGSMNAYLPKDAGKQELEWASAYRSLCRTAWGFAPGAGGGGRGRLSHSKPSTRQSFIETDEHPDSEEADPGSADHAAEYEESDEGDDGLGMRIPEAEGPAT